LLLLLALVLIFVIEPALRQIGIGDWLYDLLIVVVLLAGFVMLFKRRRYRVVALLLGVPTVVANWTRYALPGLPTLPLALAFHCFAALFIALTLAAILQDLHEARQVSSDSLYGGLIGYLLIGALFGHLYAALDHLSPGDFRVSDPVLAQRAAKGLPLHLLTYFSFATLTTIGYGDIIPTSPSTRALACLEAVAGQFYMVAVMAELIGLKLSREIDGQPPDPGAGRRGGDG
jgi:hypothetical protein